MAERMKEKKCAPPAARKSGTAETTNMAEV
jgi:hypothetical protein